MKLSLFLTGIEFDVIFYFSGADLDLNGVVSFNTWVWITDCSSIVCNHIWNFLRSHTNRFNFAEFVLERKKQDRIFSFSSINLHEFYRCFFSRDTMNTESAFDIVNQTEMFVCFLDGDNIWTRKSLNRKLMLDERKILTHKTGWKYEICSNTTINFN